MSLSTPFIHRPVGTTLLTIALGLAGVLAYFALPVSPLPQVEFPTVQVSANLPGADPRTMASAVATPLERQFGRIAGLTEMTSTSTLGAVSIVMQFDLNRDINAAARDVQAAINAARGNLPTNLPATPSYRKVNPADAPIMILSLTSDVYDKAKMYDVASTILAQKLSQVDGVGQVVVGGGALPAVRIEVNPTQLNNAGLSMEDVSTALIAANANRPKGSISGADTIEALGATDQLLKASEYAPVIVAYRNGAPVRISDIGTAVDSVEDVRNAGVSDGKPAILMIVFRQPGANIISTVDLMYAIMPTLQAQIPAAIHLGVVMDRTTTIRGSVDDVEGTLSISIALVILVVFLFLRDWRTTLIPGVAVPLSLVGTLGVMYLLGYSIDNLSLMALTIATGFVVDDAIVVIENITRHLEQGVKPMQAALIGAQEIGFTVLSMSVSLIAVFIPILMMAGIVGRLFREFAVVLSVAVMLSLVISLTTTPMMCARLLRSHDQQRHGRFYRASEWFFDRILAFYEVTLAGVLRHPLITLGVTVGVMGLSVYLFFKMPTDFFPQQDVGRLTGGIVGDQDMSFQAMEKVLNRVAGTVSADPGVQNVIGFTGGGNGSATNSGRMYITLKPLAVRKISADGVINRLRPKLAKIPGATLYLQAQQDLRIGGARSNAQYTYILQGDNLADLTLWAPRVLKEVAKIKGLTDPNSDQQDRGLESELVYDRTTMGRLNITAATADNALYDAFGQRQVSTMYTALNQYHVVMEAAPQFWQNPEGLKYIYVQTSNGGQVPLSAFAHYEASNSPLSVAHFGQFPAVTISFNLGPGKALGDAEQEIEEATARIGLPATIHGSFSGTAQAFQATFATLPILVAAAIVAIYIVLGVLYESLIHPITILSTIPSAGVGAFLALLLCGMKLDLISFIGIVLLIGIVKKNAIMMIDFALETERHDGKSPKDSIFQAALLRFRPITMTTMAAMLGGLPLAIGGGVGSELRRPLGVAIVGGLIFSQALTLYTTPVIYLYMDRLRLWLKAESPEGEAAHDGLEPAVE